jgi:hypothetical protein
VRPLPLLSVAAAAALVVTAGAANAATVTTPAAGDATSTIVLGEVVAAGTDVVVGTLELVTSTTGTSPVAQVVVTPLSSGGEDTGKQTVTPAESPATVGAESLDLLGLGTISSPAFSVTAASPDSGPTSNAGAESLGGLELLGLPVALDGTLSAGSSVLDGGASSGKTFEVRDLALPSIGDLLEALGLDLDLLGQLVPGVLAQIVTLLDLPIDPAILDDITSLAELQDAIDAAQAAVDTAQTAVDGAQADLDDAIADLSNATTQLTQLQTAEAAAQDAVDDAQLAVDTLEAEIDQLVLDIGGLSCAVVPLLCADLEAAQEELVTAEQTLEAAETALSDAADAVDAQELVVGTLTTAVATAQALVDELQATLDGLIDELTTLLEQLDLLDLGELIGQIVALLDGVSLLSLEKLSVITSASATSASEGGQNAEIIGGELVGLEVLGTDVLALPEIQTVLGLTDGENAVDIGALVGDSLAAVDEAIAGLTGIVTGLLDGAVPGLEVPAIEVGLLERSTETAIVDGFGVATATLGGLSIAVPAITVPDLTALLPDLTAQSADVTAQAVSDPVTITLGEISESARFRPAAVTQTPGGDPTPTPTPTTGTPGTTGGTTGTTTTTSARPLPRTGAPALVALVGLGLLTGAALMRRNRLEDDLVE